jgi:hypothetical protein
MSRSRVPLTSPIRLALPLRKVLSRGWQAWRIVLIGAMLTMPGAGASLAAQSPDGLDIDVRVLPATTPAEVPPWPGRALSGAFPGTVSAALSESSSSVSDSFTRTTGFDLVVLDERAGAPGWVITVSHAQDDQPAPLVLSRYLRRTEPIGDHPVQQDRMPRGSRLSVGQQLDRTTPVMKAQPGAGTGAYWLRFAVSGELDDSAVVHVLIVSTSTAP